MSAERGIYMVLEYAPYDLSLIVRRMTEPFSMGKIKCIVHQLLQGIHFMHSNGLMHRDIKTPNLLLTEDGILKLAGSSRINLQLLCVCVSY
jgi:serine/threonine protein kinase